MSEANGFMDRFREMWRAPTPNGFAALFHLDGVFRHPSMKEPLSASRAVDYMRGLQRTFPDISLEVRRWAASGDYVLVEYTIRGTINGRELSWDGADRFTLRDGGVIEGVAYFDTAALQAAIAAATSGGTERPRGNDR